MIRQLCIKSYEKICICIRLLQSGCHMHLLNMVSLWNLSYSSGKVSKWRRKLAEQHYHYWWNMGQGLWTWVKASVSWMETWRITAKTEISSESISWIVILVNDAQWVILCLLCHMVKLLMHGTTYATYLQNHLRRAVRRKWPQLQIVIILHDNVPPHKEICVGDLLWCGMWELLEHPPYSPDFSPCDYDLIPKLKAPLCGHTFRRWHCIAVRRLFMTNFSHGEADGLLCCHIVGSAELTVLGITLKACKILKFVKCFLH